MKLIIKRDVLYRRIESKDNHVLQLVTPEHFTTLAFKAAHDDMGHLGRDKTGRFERTSVLAQHEQ